MIYCNMADLLSPLFPRLRYLRPLYLLYMCIYEQTNQYEDLGISRFTLWALDKVVTGFDSQYTNWRNELF